MGVSITITIVITENALMDTPKEALERAIAICGGPAAFALAITSEALPVGQSKVSMWKNRGRGAPAEFAPAIFRETSRRGRPVTCEELAPRVDWSVLRMQAGEAA